MQTSKTPAVKQSKFSVNFNYQRVLDYVAHVVAYLALFVMAGYGMRRLLDSLQSTASMVITVLSVLALGYIISRK